VRYVGAIDQGTTSSRFIVFDASGAIVSVAHNAAVPVVGPLIGAVLAGIAVVALRI
jgi:glycerol kinase